MAWRGTPILCTKGHVRNTPGNETLDTGADLVGEDIVAHEDAAGSFHSRNLPELYNSLKVSNDFCCTNMLYLLSLSDRVSKNLK